jgi:hypothetical protein
VLYYNTIYVCYLYSQTPPLLALHLRLPVSLCPCLCILLRIAPTLWQIDLITPGATQRTRSSTIRTAATGGRSATSGLPTSLSSTGGSTTMGE